MRRLRVTQSAMDDGLRSQAVPTSGSVQLPSETTSWLTLVATGRRGMAKLLDTSSRSGLGRQEQPWRRCIRRVQSRQPSTALCRPTPARSCSPQVCRKRTSSLNVVSVSPLVRRARKRSGVTDTIGLLAPLDRERREESRPCHPGHRSPWVARPSQCPEMRSPG